MRALLIFSCLIVATMAQRGSYAGSAPIGKPGLASRFKGDEDNDTTNGIDLSNRIGDTSTERIPVDARGDQSLVERLNQWPKEHRPFWLINAEHIEAHRRRIPTVPSQTNQNGQTVQTASRFGETQNTDGVISALPPFHRPSFAGQAPRF